MVALCGVPLVTTIDVGVAVMLVSEKLAGVLTPATDAVTVYPPGFPLAVNVAEVATPDALVVAVFTLPANVPPAPLEGAVNVTVSPAIPLPPTSFTVAARCVAKAVLTGVLWGVPVVAVIEDGDPAVLVSAKFAAADASKPGTVAVTV
jgi:hypothetical protein